MPDRTLAECHILIVEDEFMLAEDLRDELEEAGAIVLGPTPDVAEALALLADANRVHGAVLDINLAGELSYPIADELLRRGIPFLLTTGYDPSAIPERYRHIAQCPKPVRVTAVREAIGRVIHM